MSLWPRILIPDSVLDQRAGLLPGLDLLLNIQRLQIVFPHHVLLAAPSPQLAAPGPQLVALSPQVEASSPSSPSWWAYCIFTAPSHFQLRCHLLVAFSITSSGKCQMAWTRYVLANPHHGKHSQQEDLDGESVFPYKLTARESGDRYSVTVFFARVSGDFLFRDKASREQETKRWL